MSFLKTITGITHLFPQKAPASPQMSNNDKCVIFNYAKCEKNSLKIDAARIHRKNIPIIGVRGNIYQSFMAEVTNSCPDLALISAYRHQVIEDGNSIGLSE